MDSLLVLRDYQYVGLFGRLACVAFRLVVAKVIRLEVRA